MPARSVLVVMARYPQVGVVKTRLARRLGAERACALYSAFLRDIETRFIRGPRPLVWAFTPAESDFPAVVSAGARCLPQEGHDLGARMHNCFRRLCGEGFERVLMVGADAPHVRDEWLDEAESWLDGADLVLGPSLDGGYYLIAMRQPHDVFSGVRMSTASVLADTCHQAAQAGLRVHLLPQSFDIDAADDLVRLQQLLHCGDTANLLPATAAVLRSWDVRERS